MQAAKLGIEQDGEQTPADVSADHEYFAMREVDHEQHAVDHRIAQGQQSVDRA